MAVALQVDDILRVVINTRVANTSQTAKNTLHYRVTNVIGAFTDRDAADGLSQYFAPFIKPMITPDVSYTGLTTQIVAPAGRRRPFTSSTRSAGAGTASGVPCPGQVTALIRGSTETYVTKVDNGKIRVAQGRVYVPFPPASLLADSGRMSNPYLSQLQSLAGAYYSVRQLIGGAGGGGTGVALQPVLRHRNGANVIVYTTITSYRASASFATQQRRGDRGKRED